LSRAQHEDREDAEEKQRNIRAEEDVKQEKGDCTRGLFGRERRRLFIAPSLLVETLGWVELAFKAIAFKAPAPKGPVGLHSP
jgi:hypothetical protein